MLRRSERVTGLVGDRGSDELCLSITAGLFYSSPAQSVLCSSYQPTRGRPGQLSNLCFLNHNEPRTAACCRPGLGQLIKIQIGIALPSQTKSSSASEMEKIDSLVARHHITSHHGSDCKKLLIKLDIRSQESRSFD